MPNRGLSLRLKFVLVFLLMTLVPLSIEGYRDYASYRRIMRDRANHALRAAASQTADRIDQFFRSHLNFVRAASRLPIWQEFLAGAGQDDNPARERAERSLEAMTHQNELFTVSCALLDAQGRNLIDTFHPDEGNDESDRAYFRAVARSGKPFFSPVEFSIATGQAVIHFSHPILNARDEVTGVLRMRYSSGVLNYLVDSAQGLGGEGSFAMLIDENLLRLAQANAPEDTFRPLAPLSADRADRLRAQDRLPPPEMLRQADGTAEFVHGLRNVERGQAHFVGRLSESEKRVYAATAVRMRTQPWFVVFLQPEDVFQAPIMRQARTSLGFILLTMAAAALVAVLVAELLTRPIVRLTQAAADMAAGSADTPVDAARGDELGQLSRTFMRMRRSIGEMLQELREEVAGRREAEREVLSKNEELMSEIEERRTAQEELAANRDNLEKIVRERTARLTAAQEELVKSERLAVLGQLTGTVAHELRNPLGTIRASLFALSAGMGDDAPPAARRATTRIERNIMRCDQIIEELLDYTRITELDRSPVQLDVWLRETMADAGVPEEVELTLNADCRQVVMADAERLRRCLLNVVRNACEAMTSRGDSADRPKVLTVETRQRSDRVEIEVRDTGPGMDRQCLERIFEPLFSTKSFGVGLGLPTVRRAMEQHGGGIEVGSTPGSGTRVVLWLPLMANK